MMNSTGLEGKTQVGTTIDASTWNGDGINDNDDDDNHNIDDIDIDQPHAIGDSGIYKSSLFGLQINKTVICGCLSLTPYHILLFLSCDE